MDFRSLERDMGVGGSIVFPIDHFVLAAQRISKPAYKTVYKQEYTHKHTHTLLNRTLQNTLPDYLPFLFSVYSAED